MGGGLRAQQVQESRAQLLPPRAFGQPGALLLSNCFLAFGLEGCPGTQT